MTRTALGSSHTTSQSVCSILSSCPLSALRSFLLDSAAPEDSSEISLPFEAEPPILSAEDEVELQAQPLSPISLVQQAEYLYRQQHHEEAYRLARQAYSIDPYDWRGNLIYVATMVDLGLKNELFYLGESSLVSRLSLSHHRSALPSGHELVHTHPKLAISWYTVACYYWTTKKYESAQKYLMKATKIDKRSVSLCLRLSLSLFLSLLTSLTSGGRFSNAWVLLGHVLAAQEESEHAISAYRTACRVLPGHHEPQVFMAKELVSSSDCPFQRSSPLSLLADKNQ